MVFVPVVVNTWNFAEATTRGWEVSRHEAQLRREFPIIHNCDNGNDNGTGIRIYSVFGRTFDHRLQFNFGYSRYCVAGVQPLMLSRLVVVDAKIFSAMEQLVLGAAQMNRGRRHWTP